MAAINNAPRNATQSGPQLVPSRDLRRSQNQSVSAYSDSTSWLHVLVVSLLAFTPAFAFAILIEFLPLQPPSAGWKANWVFWIRLLLSSSILAFGGTIQMKILVPAAELTVRLALFVAFGTSIGFVLQILLIASLWRFPMPFLIIVGNPAWQIARYVSLMLAVGIERWRTVPEIKQQMAVAKKVVAIQSLLLLIYPIYNAVFLRLHGLNQVAFVLLLPAIKFFMMKLLTRATIGIPEATAFGFVTVELFDALYLFKCMQTAGSMLSGACLIAVDSLHNIYHFWHLRKCVEQVKQHLPQNGTNVEYNDIIRRSLSRWISRSRSILRIRNPNSLKSSVSVAPGNKPVPGELGMTKVSMIKNACIAQARLDKSVQILLLECEQIVLTEFIECAVPMYYALYLAILFHLPSAKYYPEMRHLDSAMLTRTVCNILIYASLELASLLYLHVFLYRRFHISMLHLLANLLERENTILQSVFMTWVVIVLQFTLEHGGVDFSFQFRWD